MKRYTNEIPQTSPALGPSLVLRGALLMSILFVAVFSWVSNEVARAEADQVELQATFTDQPAKPSHTKCEVSPAFPDKVYQWCSLITQFAKSNDLPPDLIAALIWQESGGNPTAYSHSGAVGLMQVMPRDGIAATFICQNGPCFASRPTIAELEDPEFNIAYGTGMLSGLVNRLGSLRQALKAYGPMDAGFSYADKVLSLYENYGMK